MENHCVVIQSQRIKRTEVLLSLLLLLSPARAITVFLLPLALFVLISRFPSHLRYKQSIAILITIFILSSLFGLATETTSLGGVILSCVIFLPMILFLFYEPSCYIDKKELYNKLAKPFLYFLLVIDILGCLYKLRHGGVDDYGWAYGKHYEYVHGLAMINTFIFLWFAIKLLYGRLSRKEWLILSMIVLSIIGCGYGLGIICLFLTFVVLLCRLGKRKSLLILCLLLIGVYEFSRSPHLEYERENIVLAMDNVDVRKITMFHEFISLLKDDNQIFMIGTGPGGYNSRSALLLSGDNQNFVNKTLGDIQPIYYKKYIYPLWNRTFVSQAAHTDGTRNKPFSSFVSIWAELGVFFIVIFAIIYIKLIKQLRRYKRHKVEYYFLLSLDIFMVFSLISHLWLETTEFIVYCLIRFFVIMSLKSEHSAKSHEE